MKKTILKLASIIFCCAALASCVDDNYMELDKGHDELTLSVNASEFVLNEAEHGADALALTWTTGTNFGTGNKHRHGGVQSTTALPCDTSGLQSVF